MSEKSVDFRKTPLQVGKEIEHEIEALQRQLTVSRGHGEKGASAVLNVVLVVVVLAGQFAISVLFEKPESVTVKQSSTTKLSEKDERLVSEQLSRIEQQIERIRATKSVVAPNMAIEGNAEAIVRAAKDIRVVLGVNQPYSIGGD